MRIPHSKTESEPSEKSSAPDISQNSNSKSEGSRAENSSSQNSNSKTDISQNSNSKPESEPSEQSSKPESSQNSNSKPESSAPASESKPESKPESSAPAPEPPKQSKAPVAVASVTLSRHELSMTVGDRVQLSAEVSPYDADDQQLTWYWSDTSVITIDNSATVTAAGAGKATITVKANNGKYDECIVTVKAKEQPKPVESSTKPVEQSKPSEVSKPSEQSSKPPEPSQAISEPIEASKEQSTQIDPKYAAYYYPYDDAAIIAELREIGEKQYKMVWEDSLWVRSKGTEWGSKYDEEWGYRIVNGKYQGTCGFRFPVSNTESIDGERFRNYCASMFDDLKRFAGDEPMENVSFKIVIEDVTEPGSDYRVIWVYLLYV